MTVATNPLVRLEDAALAAVRSVGGADADGLDAGLKPSAKPEFGDFQLNCAMALGKKSGRPPRDVAALLVEEPRTAACTTPRPIRAAPISA